MRLLHTSDWHLGKRLFDKERYDVFENFLTWLLSTIRKERVDTLIVAGDIFDTAVPTNKSLRLYYDFLSQLTSSECRHVVIVSGNHDSPTLLEAPKGILENFGVHVIGGAESPEDEVIELKDKAGNLEGVVCAVPFLRERDILRLKDDSTLSRAEEIQLAVEIITRVLLKRLLIGWEPKEFLSLLPVICLRSDLLKEKTLTSFI